MAFFGRVNQLVVRVLTAAMIQQKRVSVAVIRSFPFLLALQVLERLLAGFKLKSVSNFMDNIEGK